MDDFSDVTVPKDEAEALESIALSWEGALADSLRQIREGRVPAGHSVHIEVQIVPATVDAFRADG